MRPLRPALLTLLITLLVACAAPAQPQIRAALGAVEAVNAENDAGFAKVSAPRPFSFPADHGPHPDFQTEWWYYTGNLRAADGRRFGFQLTFFRRALTPAPAERESAWGASAIYMAHFALSDIDGGAFYAHDRFSRDAAGLAGASGAPFRVFLEDWSAEGSGPEDMTMRLRAAAHQVAIDLSAASTRPPVLQGDAGVSQKGPSAGNASYYYSLTRMATKGTITVAGEPFTVEGLTWMDREWSTSALEGDVVGWDWFALQLDDGSDLMYYQLRQGDGGVSPYTAGSLVLPDGSVRRLSRDELTIEVLDSWQSPRSGATYPARWRLRDDAAGLDLEITPHLADQELPVSVIYWEGAVGVRGSIGGQPVSGNGYVELTGYVEARQGRF
jgi:predicted secreted hydrolase